MINILVFVYHPKNKYAKQKKGGKFEDFNDA